MTVLSMSDCKDLEWMPEPGDMRKMVKTEDLYDTIDNRDAMKAALEAFRDWILSGEEGFPDEAALNKALALTRAAGIEVDIEGLGLRTVEDTGSTALGAGIDVYVEDTAAAVRFGRKTATVRILEDKRNE